MINEEKEAVQEGSFQAELCLGSITLSLNDYLALQPGDAIDISADETLRAVLRVGGLSVATGKILFQEGKLHFEINDR